MRHLNEVTDLPFVTPSGRFVVQPGYCDDVGIYLHCPPDQPFMVPETPSADDVRAATAVLMRPWRGYSFASSDDAAGMVSAVLAALVRPVLVLCPALGIGASQQGTGKTKAAAALGALIEGRHPAVTPFAGTSTDDELRKRMVAGAIDGVRFHCIDNVVGHFKSSALASVLTSGRVSDRVLGQSRMVDASIRALVTLTGNNASIDADLQRRIVQVRIDGGERPTHRAFDFDPVSEALAQRRSIAVAALTVLRAYFNAGAPDVLPGDAGGFACWNRLCRQPVLWLSEQGLSSPLPWSLGDPAASMLADPADSDPEIEALGDLLRALWAITDGADFTAAEAVQWHQAGANHDGVFSELRSAVVELVGKTDVSARGMGRVLRYRRERTVNGLRLLARSAAGPMKSWRVVRSTTSAA